MGAGLCRKGASRGGTRGSGKDGKSDHNGQTLMVPSAQARHSCVWQLQASSDTPDVFSIAHVQLGGPVMAHFLIRCGSAADACSPKVLGVLVEQPFKYSLESAWMTMGPGDVHASRPVWRTVQHA